ncbi:MAG: hypothetical protein M3174_02095 [Actinomycetota bacterium]|nr:hypothetical protein [Actinomycetota bacterium]
MRLLRLMGDLSQLRREFRDLATESAAQEEQAKYELTTSARRFSRRARHVVDDKLSFSATLMRAGEVDAANRLLEEVHDDVRTEEAALIEKMNEVKVARAATRESMSRVRLARMLAVSLVGSLLMGFSALGMAAAGFVEDREQDEIRRNAAAQRRALEDRGSRAGAIRRLKQLDGDVRKVLLAVDLPVASLSPAEVRRIGILTDGAVDLGALQEFLVDVLDSPDLAAEVAARIATQVESVTTAAGAAAEEAPSVDVDVSRVKRKAQRVERSGTAAGEASDEETSEASPSPTPEETEPPAEENETEQTEENGNRHETGGDDDKKGGSGEGGGNVPGGEGLPLDGGI